jgi:hypothetical protein
MTAAATSSSSAGSSGSAPNPDEDPLIFIRGKYGSLRNETRSEPQWPLPMHY